MLLSGAPESEQPVPETVRDFPARRERDTTTRVSRFRPHFSPRGEKCGLECSYVSRGETCCSCCAPFRILRESFRIRMSWRVARLELSPDAEHRRFSREVEYVAFFTNLSVPDPNTRRHELAIAQLWILAAGAELDTAAGWRTNSADGASSHRRYDRRRFLGAAYRDQSHADFAPHAGATGGNRFRRQFRYRLRNGQRRI